MRRELSLVGMSLVAYACALVLGSLIICVGLSLLQDFRTGPSGEANAGQIYNPENGRTYRASLKLRTE
jgi:uncharacterized protein (DUF2147 family)